MLGDLEVLYQMRIVKITNLGDWFNKFMVHEKNVYYDVASLRSNYQTTTDDDQKVKIIDNLKKAFGGILANVENYTTLKSDQTVARIMSEIDQTEDEIVTGRNSYNQTVQDFNQTIRSFPIVLIATSMQLKTKEYFKVELAKT